MVILAGGACCVGDKSAPYACCRTVAVWIYGGGNMRQSHGRWVGVAVLCTLVLGLAGCPTAPKQTRTVQRDAFLCPPPGDYPQAALAAEAEGVTRIGFTVQPDGRVTNARVVSRSGTTPAHAVLDAQALSAVRDVCRFAPQPGTLPAQVVLPFRWQIE